jgi:hypothetical protein
VYDADDHGKDAPSGHIANGDRGNRCRPQTRPHQVVLLDDAREHREGGDAHRDPEEQCKRKKAEPMHAEFAEQEQRERSAEDEGKKSAEVRDQHRGLGPSPERAKIEHKADRKHEKDDSDIAEEEKAGQRALRKQETLDFGKRRFEQRRAKQNTSEYLADHPRLSEAAQLEAADPGDPENGQDLQYEAANRRAEVLAEFVRYRLQQRASLHDRARRGDTAAVRHRQLLSVTGDKPQAQQTARRRGGVKKEHAAPSRRCGLRNHVSLNADLWRNHCAVSLARSQQTQNQWQKSDA